MNLKFRDIFPGKAVRTFEEDHKTSIDCDSIPVGQGAVVGDAVARLSPADRFDSESTPGTRDANDRNSGGKTPAGKRDDCFGGRNLPGSLRWSIIEVHRNFRIPS
jgi:hypothetical protein